MIKHEKEVDDFETSERAISRKEKKAMKKDKKLCLLQKRLRYVI